MATVHTILTPEVRHTPFTGGSDAQRLIQGAARGESRYFSSTASNWPATGSGIRRSLAVNINLDRDYAWVLTDMSAIFLKLSAGDSIKMDAVAMVEIAMPVPGGNEYVYTSLVSHPSRQNATGNTPIGDILADNYNTQYPILDVAEPAAMTFVAADLPNYMLYPFDNTNNTVGVTPVFSEAATSQSALSVRFSARFLQYDISQAYDWRVQSPLLTR